MRQILGECQDKARITLNRIVTVLINGADWTTTLHVSIVGKLGTAVADVDGAVIDLSVDFETGESLADGCCESGQLDWIAMAGVPEVLYASAEPDEGMVGYIGAIDYYKVS